ncbi:MAG: hypothetical protein ACRDAU_04085 [Clostridium sp.]
MGFYYENKLLIFKIEAKLHKKVVLYYRNYKKHIHLKHGEITLKKIVDILENPDYVYKSSRKSEVYYYEKSYNGKILRVVIKSYKRNVKCVITAYKVEVTERFTSKHIYCVYDKEIDEKRRKEKEEFKEDTNYFYELFNIEK